MLRAVGIHHLALAAGVDIGDSPPVAPRGNRVQVERDRVPG